MVDLTNNGVCSRCGQCCSNFIPLTDTERNHLIDLCKKDDTEVQIKTLEDGRIYMLCPFLIYHPETSTTSCSIYNDRPSICRKFKCDTKQRMSKEESKDYKVTDLMKDVIHYDYQKENNMTYEEAMMYHIQLCKKDREEEVDGKKNI